MTDQGTPNEPRDSVTLPTSTTPDADANYSPQIFLREKVDDDERRENSRRAYYVGVHIETRDNAAFGLSGNISPGGLFVVTEDPPVLGDFVELDFLLADDASSLKVEGEVRWVRQEWSEDGKRPPGFGVEFVEIDPIQRELLADLIDKLDASPEMDDS